MSAHVATHDVQLEWKLGSYSAYAFPEPALNGNTSSPRSEYFVLPEHLVKLPTPIVSVYKAPTWKPFVEDYILRLGPPHTSEGLRAVCVFMTATDVQLAELGRGMATLGSDSSEHK